MPTPLKTSARHSAANQCSMRLALVLILPMLLVGLLVDWYIVRAVWRRCSAGRRFWRPFALWSSVLCQIGAIVAVCWPKRAGGDGELLALMWILYSYLSVYLPKAIFCIIDLAGKIPALFGRKRLRGFASAGIALALLCFGFMWWGALVNRYNVDVREVAFSDSRLPDSFDGFRVAQISDLHVGSYGTDTAFVSRLVDAVNALNPDVVVFTGDIVNRRSAELLPFVQPLSRLKAPMGVYSVLGNHDYGDYYNWPDSAAKEANLRQLVNLQGDMGWDLLLNRTAWLRRGEDSLALVGVENVGDPPFHCYGDLETAYPGDLADPAFKILLSHNPAHWTMDIEDSPDKNIPLTLSGHTHAMQMSAFGLSPAAFRYPTWGGMYADGDAHSLYVNIGAGEVGIPARIGATPEITLFTLSK